MTSVFDHRCSLDLETPAKRERRRVLTPQTLFAGLARELERLAPVYATLRGEHPALSAFPTLESLMDRLTVGPRDDAKTALIASLLAIRQSSPHRLWVAILLRAFRPMLAKLWKTLFGSDRQERLALLILAFQEGLRQVDPTHDPVRIAMYVRQATRRRAIASLVTEVEWESDGFGEEADTVPDEREPDSPGERRRAAHRFLARGELAAHVRRAHPEMRPEDQARLCRRLRRGLRKVASMGTTQAVTL